MSWNPGYDPTTNHYQLAGTSYDASGNVTNDSFNAYAWDPYNKMLSVNSTACGTNGNCSTYDAFGRIVEFSKNSTYKENWYTQAGTVVMSGTTLAEAYLRAPGGGSFMELGGQNDYLHKDWLGNARIGSLIGSHAVAADMAYAPYGEVYNFIAGSGISQMFTGDLTQLDSEVLFDTPNRELAASNQGRWLSPDPAGAGWNQYAYATNPNSSNDPSGLYPTNGAGWQYANGQGPMDWAAFGLDGGFGGGGGGGGGGTVGADAGSSSSGDCSQGCVTTSAVNSLDGTVLSTIGPGPDFDLNFENIAAFMAQWAPDGFLGSAPADGTTLSYKFSTTVQSGFLQVDNEGNVSVVLLPATGVSGSLTINGPTPDQTVIAEVTPGLGDFAYTGTDIVIDTSGNISRQGIIIGGGLSWPPNLGNVSSPLSNFYPSGENWQVTVPPPQW